MACSIVKKDIKNAFLKLLGNNLKRPYEKYVGWKYLKLTEFLPQLNFSNSYIFAT